MLRWIILLQAVIYLVIMPFFRSQGEAGYRPPIVIGLIGVLALSMGMLPQWRRRAAMHPAPLPINKLEPRRQLWIGIVLLAGLYIAASLAFGLFNRRQGSELMAEIFGTLPLWALAIIRGYELLLTSLIILYTFAAQEVPVYQRVAVSIALLVSLPFMGISDSRGRILVIAISVLSFISLQDFFNFALKRIRLYVVALITLGIFWYMSVVRASNYYSVSDYFQIEIFQRLDGLNLVAKLRDARLLSYFGEFDYLILSPLISKIPFLDAAREAKLIGRTSSKQYYIQDILRDRYLDDSNSMITDPLYFGGIAGLVICFVVFGYTIARFDGFIARGGLFEHRGRTALAIAFATSFVMFENDFVFGIVGAVQTFVIVLVLLWLGCQRRSPQPSPTERVTPLSLPLSSEPALNERTSYS